MSLKDKCALITGASSGIGAACAHALAGQGARVILSGRNEAALKELAQATGGQAISADLRDMAEVEQLFTQAGERIDILINSAGIAPRAPIIDGDPDHFRELLEVNVLALTRCCQLALPRFDPVNGGHIINLSSMSGHRVPPSGGFYAATKFAVRAVTEALRYELKAGGNRTRVATISPGFVDTPLLNLYFKGSEDKLKALREELDMLDPADVAAAVLHVLQAPGHVEIGDIQLRPAGQGV
ncbi:MAG: SDR family oxidoreductase [Verrucomicrobiales bacterium]